MKNSKIKLLFKKLNNNKLLLPLIGMHLTIMVSIVIILILGIFFIILPIYTRHNKCILIPNLKGKQIAQVADILKKRGLQYNIVEKKSFSYNYQPDSIILQDPIAGSQVKKNRTIYISLNAKSPPSIEMPNLLNGSIRNAQLVLKTNDLKLGYVKYIPNIAKNAVLDQYHKGTKVLPGSPIKKGSKIDLIVGSGLGKVKVDLPNLIGKTLDEAEVILKRNGLQIGTIIYNKNINTESNKIELDQKFQTLNKSEKFLENEIYPNTIYQQIPSSSTKIRRGTMVDIWIYDPEYTCSKSLS